MRALDETRSKGVQIPLKLTFRGMAPSEAVEEAVRERVAWLERFCDALVGCHVVIELPHRHHREGNVFRVQVHITAPGETITANRDAHRTHEDVHAAIRDAFDAARRRVEDYARRRRRQVKAHASPPQGV